MTCIRSNLCWDFGTPNGFRCEFHLVKGNVRDRDAHKIGGWGHWGGVGAGLAWVKLFLLFNTKATLAGVNDCIFSQWNNTLFQILQKEGKKREQHQSYIQEIYIERRLSLISYKTLIISRNITGRKWLLFYFYFIIQDLNHFASLFSLLSFFNFFSSKHSTFIS